MKKIISIVLVLLFIVSNIINTATLTSTAATYTDDYVLAVNTNTSTSAEEKLSLSNLKSSTIFKQDESIDEGEYIKEPFATYTDEITGEVITQYSRRPKPNFPMPIPKEDLDNSKPKINNIDTTEYTVGDTKNFILETSGETITESIEIECKYIGEYCTVWVDKNTPNEIRLSQESILKLANEFDANWPKEIELFGNYAEIARGNADSYGIHNGDADFDEKLAIICYDIENQYINDEPITSSYTGGFFQESDNYVDINNKDKYSTPSNCMDCIHMDTYPFMGDKNHLVSEVEKCFGTLYHEAQHLIQQSYGNKTPLPTYLNEGFSMAAEHAIAGDPIANSELISQRLSNFNTQAVSGWPLTIWYRHLYSYAPAYVFTQYLRTQYAQTSAAKAKGDTYGNEFFKLVLENYKQASENNSSSSDSVYENVILDILGVSSYTTLIKNFWRACVQVSESGIYSFNNEPWSYLISPYASTMAERSYAGYNGDISNGGAMLFSDNNNLSINTSSSKIELIPLNRAKTSDYTISNTTQSYTGDGKNLTITPNSPSAGNVTAVCYYTLGTGDYSNSVDEVYLYIPSIEGYDSLPKKIGTYKAKMYCSGGTELCSYSFDAIKKAYDYLLSDGEDYQTWNKQNILEKLNNTGLELPSLKIKDGSSDDTFYTITYVNYDSTQTLYTESISNIEDIDMNKTAPNREGYEFLGWDGLPDTLNDDVTLIASYIKIPTNIVLGEAISLDTNLTDVTLQYYYIDSNGVQTLTPPTTPGVYSIIVNILRDNKQIFTKTFSNLNASDNSSYTNKLIYRLYNPSSGEHLFTSKEGEYNKLPKAGWIQEGKTFDAYEENNKPADAVAVYRLFNPKGFKGKGDHHYTKSNSEVNKLVKAGWSLDFDGQPAFYVAGKITVYKMYDKASGAHHYTPKLGEKNNMEKAGWVTEGIAWTVNGYYSNNGTQRTSDENM